MKGHPGDRATPSATPCRGSAPEIPLADAIERLLEAQKAEHRLKAEGVICPWVFNRSNRKVKGKRITTFIKAFRAVCTKAGCPGRIPHDLRRTAVRNLVRAGVPERVAIQMTGHKTRLVFERYNIVSECDLVEAARSSTSCSLPLFRLKAEATRQTVTGLPRRSRVAAKSGTIRAQWSPIAVPA